jgi:alpha/beta superfamily hydrolase
MHNKVIYQTAKSLSALGLPVLRFNFRGTGLSAGTHARGQGEREDVRAALDFLATEYPDVALLLAGFSFGSWVGLRVACEDPRVTELIGLGVPVGDSDFSYLSKCAKTKLFVQGGNDEFGAPDKLAALVASLPGDNLFVEVPGVNHFFAGKLDELDRAITTWLTDHHPALRIPHTG